MESDILNTNTSFKVNDGVSADDATDHDKEMKLNEKNNEKSTKNQCDHIENLNFSDSENNLVDVTPVENTELGSVQNCHIAHDVITSEVESRNESVDKETFCEFMNTCDTERNEEEISPVKSQVSSLSSGSTSPNPEMFDSTSDACPWENEKLKRVSDKNCTLPYFQLPKPDLDEYLVKTNEFLSGNKKNSLSLKSLDEEHMEKPKRKSVLDEFLSKFQEEKTISLYETNSKCNEKLTRTSISQEYSKVISCLGQLDESKSPGIKRLALKEFLQKKINEKKSAAFNRSKEISNLDEYEEVDENAEADESEEENEIVDENDEVSENEDMESDALEEKEKIKSGSESSDEDLEEPTVTFSFEGHQNNVLNLQDEERHSLNDESDEDIITVRKKPKTLQILEEDSDEESCTETNFIHEPKQKCIQSNEKEFDSQSGSVPNGPSADTQIKMGFADIPSYQPAVSLPEDVDESSHDSLISETYQREDLKILNFPESSLNHNISPIPLSMDDPPLMLSGNEPLMEDIFLSQDLAAMCSGAFKNKEKNNEPSYVTKEEKYMESKDKIKSFNKDDVYLKEADFENQVSDNSEDAAVEKEKGTLKINDFLDLEAELSGEDDGEDDPESDVEGIDDLIVSDHEVPSDAQVRDEIVDLHLKHLIDDDEEILKEYKEKFLDDGELHGDGRTRRFAWKNNGVDIDDAKNGVSSDSEDETPADSWSSMNQEKAKWREENKEQELADNLNSSYKSLLKVKIIGKPEFSQTDQDFSRRLSCKRPRGSFLHLDSASQVLKKLKTSEDACGGSRTTKHFVFRNDLPEETKVLMKVANSPTTTTTVTDNSPIVTRHVLNNRSIFSKI